MSLQKNYRSARVLFWMLHSTYELSWKNAFDLVGGMNLASAHSNPAGVDSVRVWASRNFKSESDLLNFTTFKLSGTDLLIGTDTGEVIRLKDSWPLFLFLAERNTELDNSGDVSMRMKNSVRGLAITWRSRCITTTYQHAYLLMGKLLKLKDGDSLAAWGSKNSSFFDSEGNYTEHAEFSIKVPWSRNVAGRRPVVPREQQMPLSMTTVDPVVQRKGLFFSIASFSLALRKKISTIRKQLV